MVVKPRRELLLVPGGRQPQVSESDGWEHRCGTARAQGPAGAWDGWSTDTVQPVPCACMCQTVETAFGDHACSLHPPRRSPSPVSLSAFCHPSGSPGSPVCVTRPLFCDTVPDSNAADPGHPLAAHAAGTEAGWRLSFSSSALQHVRSLFFCVGASQASS